MVNPSTKLFPSSTSLQQTCYRLSRTAYLGKGKSHWKMGPFGSNLSEVVFISSGPTPSFWNLIVFCVDSELDCANSQTPPPGKERKEENTEHHNALQCTTKPGFVCPETKRSLKAHLERPKMTKNHLLLNKT